MPNNTDNAAATVSNSMLTGGMSDCLQGLHVVDLTRNLPGPFATRLLNDLGAKITKIEPLNGDPARALGGLFQALNHGKHTQKIDFRSAEGIDTIKAHIKEADVMLDSFRPGVLEKMGLDNETLHQINPKLVIVSILGYGIANGTDSNQENMVNKAGHDINFMSMSGVLDQLKTDDGKQAMPNIQFADLAGGSDTAVIALLAAVLAAQRTNKGRHIYISMTHSLYNHMVMPKATAELVKSMVGNYPTPENDFLGGLLPCYRLYRTQDSRYMAVGSLELKFWQELCEILQVPELKYSHWQRGVLPNTADSQRAAETIAEIFASQPLSHWQEEFADKDVCVTPVLTLEEAKRHPLFVQQDEHLATSGWQSQ